MYILPGEASLYCTRLLPRNDPTWAGPHITDAAKLIYLIDSESHLQTNCSSCLVGLGCKQLALLLIQSTYLQSTVNM